jgi:serine/threonine-protein kinase
VKVLKREIVESVGADRFLREMKYLGRLDHPRVVTLLDSGGADGHLYVVLPLMTGGTLRVRLQHERKLPFSEAVRITRDVAEALGAAHAVGLVHRDVKPENILFADGRASLTDFGIARALVHAAGEKTTSTGLVLGTPTYMSPEQAGGTSEFDGRSDLYSLGCVLYEMIAGQAPYVAATNDALLVLRMTRPPDPVARFRDRTPASLEAVIDRALATTPADRFQSAAELIAALDGVLEDLSSPHIRTVEMARRARRRFRVVGIAGGIMAGLAAAAAWYANRSVATADPIPAGDVRRVAVLYFDATTPQTVPSELTAGITEDLIDRLGSVPALHVISPNGVRTFRDASASNDSIGRALKVGTIVSGSVAQAGSRLRVTVRLEDAKTKRQFGSRQIEHSKRDLFSLLDTLTEQVQFWLRQRIGEEVAVRTNRAGTHSVQAWEIVQRAIADERRGAEAATTGSDTTGLLLVRADALYERASQLDPDWTLPFVRRGYLALQSRWLIPQGPPAGVAAGAYRAMEPRERHRIWARQALTIADGVLRGHPRDAAALALRGAALAALAERAGSARDSLLGVAERELRASLDERPDLAATWVALADVAILRGSFAEATVAARRAVEADAFSELPRVIDVALNASLYAEEFDGAREWCRLGLQRYPGDPRFAECELRILGSVGRSARDAAAGWRLVTEIERRDSLHMLSSTWGFRRLMVAAVLARGARLDSARHVLHTVQQQQPERARRSSELAACYVLTLLGDRTEAVQRFTNLTRTTSSLRFPLTLSPWFKSLRGDPRFDSLAARRL